LLNELSYVIQIVALRDIAVDEELCHSYGDCTMHRAARQLNLRDTFGFDCQCDLCEVSVGDIPNKFRDDLQATQTNGPSPLAIRDFFSTQRSSYSLNRVVNTDAWLLEMLCEPSEYAEVVQRAGFLCREAQLLELSDGCGESDEAKAVSLMEEVVRALQTVCGPFNVELYQARGKLMTSYLTAGRVITHQRLVTV
jgi:hypothetical protein